MEKKFVSKYYDYGEFYNNVVEFGFPNERYLINYGREIIEEFFNYISKYGNFKSDERVNYEIILHNILQQSLQYMVGFDIETFGLKRFKDGKEIEIPKKTVCKTAIKTTLKFYYEFLYGIIEDKKSILQQFKKSAEFGDKFYGGRKISEKNLKDYKAIIQKANEFSPYTDGKNYRNATLYYLQSQLNRRPLTHEVDELYKRFNKYYVRHYKKKKTIKLPT